MDKLKKHRFSITIIFIGFVCLIILLSPLKNSVGALYDNAHTIAVFLRFDSDVFQKSPAGQYYDEFVFEHSWEQYQIVENHPEHLDEYWRVVRMFTPGVEALVNGKGDTVRITEEQVNSLKAEWEWESSFASPSLREGVEKELQRFPLDNFIGMTMSEALDYVNSNFPSELVLSMPISVPDSNGQWVYYTYDNIYFEYPGAWQIQQNINRNEFIFLPAPFSSEGVNLDSVFLSISSNYLIKNWNQTITDPQMKLAREKTGWMQLVYLNDFQGFEVLVKNEALEIMLYNEDEQMYVDLLAYIKKGAPAAALMDNSDVMEKVFPNIQHIIESIRIWKQ
jgi:hypothetical protein